MNKQVTAFGHKFRAYVEKENKADGKLDQIEAVLIEGTGDTVGEVKGQIDIDEFIQTQKDKCGIEVVMRQVKLGVIDPSTLADDGKHGGDATLVPQYAGDLLRQQEAAANTADKISKAYGVDLSKVPADQIEKVLTDAIAAKIAATKAATEEEKGDK